MSYRRTPLETAKSSFWFRGLVGVIASIATLKFIILHFIAHQSIEQIRNKFRGNVWVDGVSEFARHIRRNVMSWRALDALYRYDSTLSHSVGWAGWWDYFWPSHLAGVKGLRNRARLVEREFKKALQYYLAQNDGSVNVLSVGVGSLYPVLHVLSELPLSSQSRISYHFMDRDPSAIDYCQTLIEKLDLSVEIELHQQATTELSKIFSKTRFDVVEMVGFLDYRPDEKAVSLLKKINVIFKPSGTFLVSNVSPNHERRFLEMVMQWWMVYRTPSQLRSLLYQARWRKQYVFLEPMKVHALGVCQKEVKKPS